MPDDPKPSKPDIQTEIKPIEPDRTETFIPVIMPVDPVEPDPALPVKE